MEDLKIQDISFKLSVNLREAAILTGIGEAMLRRYVRSGELKAIHKGKTKEVLIPTEILKEFITISAMQGRSLD